MKKIAIFSQSNNSYEVARLIEEGTLLGFETRNYKYSDLSMEFSKGVKCLINDKDIIEENNFFIFRSAKLKNGETLGYYTKILKYLTKKKGKKCLNSLNTERHSHFATKLYDYSVLSSESIPVINTFNFATLDELERNLHKLKFPLIGKFSKGSHGKEITLLKDFNMLKSFVLKYPIQLTLFQEYISPNTEYKEDYRVITLGKEIIGGYKKVAKKGEIVTNLGSGGHAEAINNLPNSVLEICNKVIDSLEVDFSGIDIIFKDKQPLVLEVNKAPQFAGFEEATGVNLAKKIIEFLTK